MRRVVARGAPDGSAGVPAGVTRSKSMIWFTVLSRKYVSMHRWNRDSASSSGRRSVGSK